MIYFSAPGIKPAKIELDYVDLAAAKVWALNPPELIYTRSKRRFIVEPRQAVQQYKVEMLHFKPFHLTFTTGFDHATINYSCKQVNRLKSTNKIFKEKYNEFLKEIENGKNNLQ